VAPRRYPSRGSISRIIFLTRRGLPKRSCFTATSTTAAWRRSASASAHDPDKSDCQPACTAGSQLDTHQNPRLFSLLGTVASSSAANCRGPAVDDADGAQVPDPVRSTSALSQVQRRQVSFLAFRHGISLRAADNGQPRSRESTMAARCRRNRQVRPPHRPSLFRS
jgi:hypothetical protein